MRSDKERNEGGLRANGVGRCELCGRLVHELTRHHLIPRSRHKNKRNKKAFARQDVYNHIALLCRPCHRNVHATIDVKELEREYNTLDALAAHPDIKRFTRWIESKPHGVLTSS
jgi:5-methylcytosine-specific restriction endonuclease McrA